MKSITTALQNFLLSAKQVVTCDLLTITLSSGTIIYATNADVDIVWNAITWSSSQIKFARSKTSTGTGGKVADLSLELYADSTVMLNGIPLLQAIRAHALDGATVRVDTLFLSDWKTPVGTLNNFFGLVCGIESGRSSATLTVKAPTHLFDAQMPRNLFQPGCMHTLFDTQCTLNRAAYAVAGSVQAGSGGVTINCNTLTQATGYFARGYLIFNSGANNGLRYTISASTSGVGVTLSRPTTYGVVTGDTFTVYPGCDRTQSTCTSKYSNVVNFRAYPFTPVPETAF